MSSGSATATSFVGGSASHATRSPTSSHREVLELRVLAGVLGVPIDVEVIVDVAIGWVPELRRAARSTSRAGSSAIGSWSRNAAARRVDDCSPLVADDGLFDPRLLRDTGAPSGTCARSRRSPECRPPGSARSWPGCAGGAGCRARRGSGRSRRRTPGRRSERRMGGSAAGRLGDVRGDVRDLLGGQ